jgi:hypothetical protein
MNKNDLHVFIKNIDYILILNYDFIIRKLLSKNIAFKINIILIIKKKRSFPMLKTPFFTRNNILYFFESSNKLEQTKRIISLYIANKFLKEYYAFKAFLFSNSALTFLAFSSVKS